MKVHYINILLFALPLNILEHNKNEPHTTPRHTETNRSLCECELYSPTNYDSDPEMKRVMENFSKQTQQRFHEYDERMKTTRQKCKEQCNKEIQKIILKDKLEKELMDKIVTLDTDIQSDAIPTCICEKSLADKVEKVCLKCGGVLGGGVMPGFGTIGGTALYALNLLKPVAITAAKTAALTEATKAATQAGMNAVRLKIEGLRLIFGKDRGFVDLISIVNESNFNCGSALVETAQNLFGKACKVPGTRSDSSFCNSTIYIKESEYYVGNFAEAGATTYEKTLESQTSALTEVKVGAVEYTYGSCQTAIVASMVAIVVIVLIMVIIYLILRYRRKKKMKKKLQYIKLLEE